MIKFKYNYSKTEIEHKIDITKHIYIYNIHFKLTDLQSIVRSRT